MLIRPMQVADIPAGLRLCRASGWNQLDEDWRVFLASGEGGGRIAEQDAKAVGTVAWLRYGPAFTWLSMMLVDPAARRSGIGTALMESALEAMADHLCIRLDASPFGEPLYRRFGFQPECEVVRTAITVEPRMLHNPADTQPMSSAAWNEVLAHDLAAFGANRGPLLHTFLLRAPELAWVIRRGARLLGYCFGRPGYLYPQVGPVVAEDEETAASLVSACLARHASKRVAMDVPGAAEQWARSMGFQPERPFLRMRRGPSPAALASPLPVLAIAGPEFG